MNWRSHSKSAFLLVTTFLPEPRTWICSGLGCFVFLPWRHSWQWDVRQQGLTFAQCSTTVQMLTSQLKSCILSSERLWWRDAARFNYRCSQWRVFVWSWLHRCHVFRSGRQNPPARLSWNSVGVKPLNSGKTWESESQGSRRGLLCRLSGVQLWVHVSSTVGDQPSSPPGGQ